MTFVDVQRRGAASWATLNRPERGNALGPEIVAELTAWVQGAVDDPAVRALVVTGTGKAFCAGADVKASLAMADEPDRRRAFFDEGAALMRALGSCELPVVAAVNGVAFAGGFELALACDLLVADRSAVLGDLHLPHARIPAWGSAARLFSAVGPYRATRMLLLPQRFSASELCGLGLVAEVAEEGGLTDAVDRLVMQLASYDEGALRAMKRLVNDQRAASVQRALDIEWGHFAAYLGDAQMQAAPPGIGG